MQPADFAVPPVIKTITYAGSLTEAFDRFTLQIGDWWPLATHSLKGTDDGSSVSFEGLEAGGALVERCTSGAAHIWGKIIDISRPHRLSFTWQLGREPDAAQLIEVTFEATDGATSVQLTHSGWERLGDSALEVRQGYDTGWNFVLALYVKIRAGESG